jgi:hypothetical protein
MDSNDLDYNAITEFINRSSGEDPNERRKKKDWICNMSTILGLSVWVILIAVWALLEMASPEIEFGFLASFGRVHFDMEPVLRRRWDYALVYVAYVLLLISMGTSVIAFLFNRMRMKRKGDRYKKSIFVVGGISVIVFVFFLIRFSYVLF